MNIIEIRGHPNYFVCENGNILNKDSHIMTPTHDKDGYQVVRICENGNYIRLKTHRIVAEHFIPNPNNLSQVNHKDGNKDNCEATNLEWCTDSYNTQHSYDTGLHRVGEVIQIDRDGNEIARFNNAEVASNSTGIKAHNIRVAISRGTLSGGYYWKRNRV